MAALLDERPERALVLLKRFSKRASAPAEDLLHALALNQVDKRAAARALLESNGLNSWWSPLRPFRAGPSASRGLSGNSMLSWAAKWPFPGRRLTARVKVKPRAATKAEMAVARAKRCRLRP